MRTAADFPTTHPPTGPGHDDVLPSGMVCGGSGSTMGSAGSSGWGHAVEKLLDLKEPGRGPREENILAVIEQLFRNEHRAAAVAEASKAVNNRVKKMANLSGDGMGLMGNAFKDDQPTLVLADLTTQTGKDIPDRLLRAHEEESVAGLGLSCNRMSVPRRPCLTPERTARTAIGRR